jgi:formate dehydrogenase iron-sulfur subunit
MPSNMEIKQSSASLMPSTGVREAPKVAKLIDTTTCIGCKACEVACQEWNDLQTEQTHQFGTYQTLPDLTPNFWNLIRFNEYDGEGEGQFAWLMRKDQCMHCEDPGCLKACPSPGAIVQYNNGIVDFNQANCIGCGYCISGCPFDVPRLSAKSNKVYKCTMCSDRVSVGLEPACIKACPTSALQFGTKQNLLDIAEKRVDQLKAQGFKAAALYDPPGVGGTNVITVLAYGDKPELYGLPKDPKIPAYVGLMKSVLKPIGNFLMLIGVVGAFGHFMRYGKHEDPSEARE